LEVTIQLDSVHRQLELFGPADSHLRLLRQSLGVQIAARNTNLIISGEKKSVSTAAEIIDRMQKHLIKHGSLTAAKVNAFISQSDSTWLTTLLFAQGRPELAKHILLSQLQSQC
jgi:phosphate starvation-inducible protein PhoH